MRAPFRRQRGVSALRAASAEARRGGPAPGLHLPSSPGRRHLGTDRQAGPLCPQPRSALCSSGPAASPAPRYELGRRRRGSAAPPGPVSAAPTAPACPPCEGAAAGQGAGLSGLWRPWRSGCGERGCRQGSAAFRSCRRGRSVCQRCPFGRSYRAGDRGDEICREMTG